MSRGWSDAARAASLAVRRAHMRGRTLYHGGPDIRGNRIEPRGGGAYATTSLKVARSYARRADGRVYVVAAPRIPKGVAAYRKSYRTNVFAHALRSSELPKRVKFFGSPGVMSKQSLRVVRSLPRARGRASRGHY